jgi:type III secretion system YopN/LcrE/InvE/MxiC family regulator
MQILPPARQPLIVLPDSRPTVDTTPDDIPEDAAVTAAWRMRDISDELSSVLTQFRGRRSFETQTDPLMSGFEKVLDEDVLPKARQVLAAVKTNDRSVEWLLQLARNLFTDDSDLVLVLRELLRQKNLPHASRERLEQMLLTVKAQATPKRLKGGINCSLKARLFGKTLGLRARLMRDTYRSFLESDDGPVADYEDWIALFGHPHRGGVLSFIEAAVLTDIDAQDPSCTGLEFGALLGRLGQLKRLRSADQIFITTLLANDLIHQRRIDEPQLLVLMLGLLQYPDELDDLLEQGFEEAFLLSSHADRSALLGLIRRSVALLPAELFPDEDALQRLETRFTALADSAFAHETVERRSRQF